MAFDSSGEVAIITPASNLTASSHYRVQVTGGITSAKGVSLGNPTQTGYATQVFYTADFDTGTATDTTKPTVSGTTPAASATGVSVSNPVIVSFSEAMNPSTITATTVLLKLGSTSVATSLSYDPDKWTATVCLITRLPPPQPTPLTSLPT